jgi:hypothetical protein
MAFATIPQSAGLMGVSHEFVHFPSVFHKEELPSGPKEPNQAPVIHVFF